MRLAFYTYSYTDRLGMPLEPALEKIAAAGYDGIDISGTHGPSADPLSVTSGLRRRTRAAAARLGLRIEAIITHANLTDSLFTEAPLDLKGSVDLAVEVGAPLVVFHMGAAAGGAGETWRRVVEFLRDAADYAAPRGVRLAVDGVWKDWIVESPEDFLRLHDEVGSQALGVNFDPCYLTLLGHNPVVVARLWGGRILHALLKDHVGSYPEMEHQILGQGKMDYPTVVRVLQEIGFAEAIAVETFTNMDFDEAREVGYATFASIMGSRA